MPTTLRNFAVTLAAVGLLSYGSISSGQQDAEQPPSDPTSIENIEESSDVAEIRPADDNEAARPDTPPEDPNSEADRNTDALQEDVADTPEATDDNESEGASADPANSDENINADNDRDEERDSSDNSNDKQLSPPEVPEQARDRDANAREDVNADWRKIDQDGVVWFYSPTGQWHIRQGNTWHAYHDGMHHSDLNHNGNYGDHAYGDRSVVRNKGRTMNDGSQQYATGYRGEEAIHSDNGQHHGQHVRYDRCGRAYVCVNGRAMYVDVSEHSQNTQPSDDRQPTVADEQYQDVPPPPAVEDRENAVDERGNVPAPPAPPSGT